MIFFVRMNLHKRFIFGLTFCCIIYILLAVCAVLFLILYMNLLLLDLRIVHKLPVRFTTGVTHYVVWSPKLSPGRQRWLGWTDCCCKAWCCSSKSSLPFLHWAPCYLWTPSCGSCSWGRNPCSPLNTEQYIKDEKKVLTLKIHMTVSMSIISQ